MRMNSGQFGSYMNSKVFLHHLCAVLKIVILDTDISYIYIYISLHIYILAIAITATYSFIAGITYTI